MKKVKTFFHIFVNSLLPQDTYYPKLLKVPFYFSLQYFTVLVFILSFIFVTSISLRLSPLKINSLLGNLAANLNKYPNDLVININKGTMTTNYDRPYFLWLDSDEADTNHLLLVVDQEATPQKINQYDSAILLTRKNIVFKNTGTADLKIIPMKTVDNDTITKSTVDSVKNTILSINKLVLLAYPLLFLVFFLFLTLVSFFSNVLYVLISAGVVYLFYHFFIQHKSRPKFVKTFQISMHAITLPMVTNYTLGVFNLKLNQSLSVLYLLLVLLFTAVGVYKAYVHEVSSHPKIHHKV